MFHLLLGIIYLAFVSLGLPDSLLGAAWPSIYPEFSVPVSYMGGISMIIAAGTIVSSLQSSRLTARFGTGRVTAFSVLLTAAALFGFSISRSYLELCLWAVPYGLGAGCVDASLRRPELEHGVPLHCGPSDPSDGRSLPQPPPLGPRPLGRRPGRPLPCPGGPSPLSVPDRPDSRGEGGYAHLFLLLRSGADHGALGQQLPGAAVGALL